MILIAEDDVDYTFLMMKILKECHPDLPYLIFGGGEEVVDYVLGALAHGRKPSLIISDISMPRKSGFDLIQEIKSNKLLLDVPVVILSTSNSTIDRLTTLSLGANAYYVKNLTFEGLKEDFNEIISKYRNISA